METARRWLRDRLSRRSPEEKQLRTEGVRDKYVFSRDARLEVVGVDAGRKDLAKEVVGRVWIRAVYSNASSALRDESGRPIHGITVGVNVDENGRILKANVLGNLDILRFSIDYDWPDAAADSSTMYPENRLALSGKIQGEIECL